jgi:hypothetical protein
MSIDAGPKRDGRRRSVVAARGGDGRPPTRPYHVAPGSWNATAIAGALLDWAEMHREPPRVLDWCPVERSQPRYRAQVWAEHYPRWPEASTVVRICGSWRGALLAAGLPVDRPPLTLPLQRRIAAARTMRAAGLTHVEIAAELGVHRSVVGTYMRAHLCDCGQSYVVVGWRCNGCANRRSPTRRWTRKELVDALRRWAQLEGRAPTSTDWRSGEGGCERWQREYPRWPSVNQVEREFGSWNGALKAAGMPTVHRMDIPRSEALTALRDAYRVLGPRLTYRSYTAWAAEGRRPSTSVLVNHFGTFNEARQAAGITQGRARRDQGPRRQEEGPGSMQSRQRA